VPISTQATGLRPAAIALVVVITAGCAQNYVEREQFEQHQSGAHNECVLEARQACQGQSDVDRCVEDKAAPCLGRVASTPDPADEKYLPSGVDRSIINPEGDPDYTPDW